MKRRLIPVTVALTAAAIGAATVLPSAGADGASPSKAAATRTAPNLQVDWILDPPSALVRGAQFSAAVVVANAGKATAGASRTSFFLTQELRPASRKHRIGRITTPRLKPGSSTVRALRAQITDALPDGRYFLYVCVDDTKKVREANERDNCVSSATDMVIGDPSRP